MIDIKEERLKELREDIMVENEKLYRKCNLMVEVLVGKELIEKWWHGANKAFDMQTPYNRFLDEPMSVFNYLLSHCDGSYH